MAKLKLNDPDPDDGFKKVKARRKHMCDNCHKQVIGIGDYYIYGEWREPRYEGCYSDSEQVGIRYVKYRICLPCDKLLCSEDAELEADLDDYLKQPITGTY